MNKKEKFRAMQLYELKKKSPGMAVFLSLLVTGAGHFYLGKIGKGFGMLLGQVAAWLILMGWVFWFIAPISAYKDAKNYNKILKLELGLESEE